MWWRFLTFCVLVSFILFVVLSCIHGRPVIHLFFQRCCEDNIENDQVIFENFGTNYLRERLVGADLLEEAGNDTLTVKEKDLDELIESLRDKLNVHDPRTRELFIDDDLAERIGGNAPVATTVENSVEMTTQSNYVRKKMRL